MATIAFITNGYRGICFTIEGLIGIVTKYSKARQNTQLDICVVKLLCYRLSRLVISYIVLCRPLELIFASLLSLGQKAIDNYQSHLFVKRGEKMTASQFYAAINRFTEEIFGIPISLSLWRHIFKVFVREKFGIDIDIIDPEPDQAINSQFGHGNEIAARYGALESGFAFVHTPEFKAHKNLSLKIHDWYDFKHPFVDALVALGKRKSNKRATRSSTELFSDSDSDDEDESRRYGSVIKDGEHSPHSSKVIPLAHSRWNLLLTHTSTATDP